MGFYFCKHGDEPSTSLKALSVSCDIWVGLKALDAWDFSLVEYDAVWVGK
jgi:hypothetical protein